MRMERFNNIYFYFVCSQLLFLPVYFYETSLFPSPISTDKAIWLHLIGIFWSAVGYFTLKFADGLQEATPPTQQIIISFNRAFYITSVFLVIIGTSIAMLQVILFVPSLEYISQLLGGDFEMGLRDAYLLSSDEGGLPGIIKMFAYAPLSVYLMSLGLLSFMTLEENDRKNLKMLNLMALGAVIIKVFFSLDRLTIMAVLLANIFMVVQKGYFKKLRYWLLFAFILFLANYLSQKRLANFGIMDFVVLYLKSGLINFQLMIDTCTQYSYGFSTILSPLSFVLKFFHLSAPETILDYQWVWNPAQFFSSYAFNDFGYFYFVLFYLSGLFLCILNNSALKKNVYSSAIYFIALYGVVSFIFVPAIRGVDFWFALLLPLLLLNRFTQVHQAEETLL